MLRLTQLLLCMVCSCAWAQHVPFRSAWWPMPALVPLSVRDARTAKAEWTVLVVEVNSWDALMSTGASDPVLFLDRSPCSIRFHHGRNRLVCVVPRIGDTRGAVLWSPWNRSPTHPLSDADLEALRAKAAITGRVFSLASADRVSAIHVHDRAALFELSD